MHVANAISSIFYTTYNMSKSNSPMELDFWQTGC